MSGSPLAPAHSYLPHEPHPKQAEFLNVDTREALYGGAAGGGKSDALLMSALQYVDVPGYSALLLRRTYADLAKPDALIPRSKEWLYPTGAKWNEQLKQWTFPSGATLSFGYLEHEDDKYHYQGAAYQFIGWDELTQFLETQYTYLFSRCRRPSELSEFPGLAGVPLRVRAASNPGGVGHDWVKARFSIDAEGGHNPARPFIPARLEDNPSLDQEAYDVSLSELDMVTRAQLRLGDWEIGAAGNVFKREWWKRYQYLPDNALRGGIIIDTATDDKTTGDPFAMATWRTSGLGFYLVRVFNQQIKFPDQIRSVLEERERSRLNEDDHGLPVYIEEVPWSRPQIDELKSKITRVFGVSPGGRSKLSRAMAISPYVEMGNVYLPEPRPGETKADFIARCGDIEAFIEQHSAFPLGARDDMVDTTSLGLNVLGTHALPPPSDGRGHAMRVVTPQQATDARTPMQRELAQRRDTRRTAGATKWSGSA